MSILITETRVVTDNMNQPGDFELREVRHDDPDRFPMIELSYREDGKDDAKVVMTVSEAEQIVKAMGPLLEGVMERFNKRLSHRR